MEQQETEVSSLPPRESDEFFRCNLCYRGMKNPTNTLCAVVDRGTENDFVIWVVGVKYRCHGGQVCPDCLLDLISGRVGEIKVQWVGEEDDVLWKYARQGNIYSKGE